PVFPLFLRFRNGRKFFEEVRRWIVFLSDVSNPGQYQPEEPKQISFRTFWGVEQSGFYPVFVRSQRKQYPNLYFYCHTHFWTVHDPVLPQSSIAFPGFFPPKVLCSPQYKHSKNHCPRSPMPGFCISLKRQ